jgi:serine/threonine protein kinase
MWHLGNKDPMTTDPTLQTKQASKPMETISIGHNCESLSSTDLHGAVIEVRVLMEDQFGDDQIARMRRQLTLVSFLMHPAIRGIHQHLSDSVPYTYSLRVPPGVNVHADRLSMLDSKLDDQSRLCIAAQIVDATAAAHRVSLFHGSFSPSTILVDRLGPSPRVHLDFTATSFAKSIPSARVLDVEHDELCLRELLRSLIGGMVESDSPADLLDAKRRQEIQRLLQVDVNPPPTVARWGTELMEFHPDPADATATGLAAAELSSTGLSSSENPTRQTSDPESGFTYTNLPLTQPSIPESLGRYELKAKIGQGGMGAVYRAVDQSNDQVVALKVLKPGGNDVGQAVRRFHKEARLLQDVKNKHVTALIDVGQDQGFHYLAMEFIDGIDLKRWLVDRGPIPETDALKIAADMARALVEAHSRQVVHRDIKPENVLLKRGGDHDWTAADGETSDLTSLPISDFTIKLTDFGIARHVSQTDSMEVTRAGTILGTPRYMSPEQCDARDVGPPADVYSLGITLFQLLTGKVPFDSKDFMEIASMHRFASPPDIQKRVPEISDATVRIVNRALAKDPEQRYGDAGQLLQELTEVLRGDSSNWQTHPKLPKHDASRLWEKTVHWKLVSPPDELWPLVSNTERLNEAIGLPAVTYRTEKDPKLGLRKFGTFTVSGIKVSWEEHPFEWIEGQRMGVLREYEAGPLRWFMSVVTLQAAAGGGTELSHQIRMEPRNVLGRVLTKIEADWKGFNNLNRVYLRMDRSIQARRENDSALVPNPTEDRQPASELIDHVSHSIDPFSKVKSLSRASLQRIEQRIDATIGKGAAETAATRLGKALTHWASQELSHLRPLAMAERLKVNGQEMVDACLIAATEGLLNLQWDVLCPTCRVTASSKSALSQIDTHTHCEACDFDFKSNLSDAIELVFRAHPEIRSVNDGQYCIHTWFVKFDWNRVKLWN